MKTIIQFSNILMRVGYIVLSALLATFGLSSCQKCELIEQIVINPPVDTCEGVFYINQTGPDLDLSFYFNEFNKPIPVPFEYATGPGPFPVPTLLPSISSNFSAYDSLQNQYVFLYYYTNGGPAEVLFHHQNIASGAATFSSPMTTYAAPVFLNGFLYAIHTELVNTNVLYQILQLDPLTGQQLGLMDSGLLTPGSPFTEKAMSSASNRVDLIYFLSGTTLVELNVENLVAKQIDLEPNFDPIDNLVQFYGLEYQRDENLLIALKNSSDNVTPTRTDLVSMLPGIGTATINTLFDVSGNLPTGHRGDINPEFYSTSIDRCDNTYYLTEMQDMNPFTTNLFEIDLDDLMMKSQSLAAYWYGIEYVEN